MSSELHSGTLLSGCSEQSSDVTSAGCVHLTATDGHQSDSDGTNDHVGDCSTNGDGSNDHVGDRSTNGDISQTRGEGSRCAAAARQTACELSDVRMISAEKNSEASTVSCGQTSDNELTSDRHNKQSTELSSSLSNGWQAQTPAVSDRSQESATDTAPSSDCNVQVSLQASRVSNVDDLMTNTSSSISEVVSEDRQSAGLIGEVVQMISHCDTDQQSAKSSSSNIVVNEENLLGTESVKVNDCTAPSASTDCDMSASASDEQHSITCDSEYTADVCVEQSGMEAVTLTDTESVQYKQHLVSTDTDEACGTEAVTLTDTERSSGVADCCIQDEDDLVLTQTDELPVVSSSQPSANSSADDVAVDMCCGAESDQSAVQCDSVLRSAAAAAAARQDCEVMTDCECQYTTHVLSATVQQVTPSAAAAIQSADEHNSVSYKSSEGLPARDTATDDNRCTGDDAGGGSRYTADDGGGNADRYTADDRCGGGDSKADSSSSQCGADETSQLTAASVRLTRSLSDDDTDKLMRNTATATAAAGGDVISDDIRQKYVSCVDISMSPLCAAGTQPLKSLADLVQKVSVISTLPAVRKNSPLPADTPLSGSDSDCVSVSSTGLYSGRVTDGPSTESALQHVTVDNCSQYRAALSQFKIPSALLSKPTSQAHRQATEQSQTQHNGQTGDCVAVCHDIGTATDTRETSSVTALRHATQSVPLVHNSTDESDGAKLLPTHEILGKGERKQKSSTPARCKNRVRKCKVDVVDVKFLKDLIVACSADGMSSCKLVTDNAVVKPPADDVPQDQSGSAQCKPNKNTVECKSNKNTVECKPSAKKSPQQKKTSLSKKTTRFLSDITLIDVAAVKSCVEKDYSEFIKSIQQSHTEDNNTEASEHKTSSKKKKKKKKKKMDESAKKTADESDVNDRKKKGRSSSKSRRSRKKNDIVDTRSDESVKTNTHREESVKTVRSRTSKKQKKVSSELVNNCQPLTVTDADAAAAAINSSVSDVIVESTSTNKPDVTVPNCSVQTSKRKGRQTKKKTRLMEAASERSMVESVTDSQSHDLTVRCTSHIDSDNVTVHELTALSPAVLNAAVNLCTNTDVQQAAASSADKPKKRRSSKKKSSPLLDTEGSADHCEADSVIDSSVLSSRATGKSRKRRSQTKSSDVTTIDTSVCEPALKHSRTSAPQNNIALTSVDTGAEQPCVLVGGASETGVLVCRAIDDDDAVNRQVDSSKDRKTEVKRAESKDERVKKTRKKTTGTEAGSKTNKIVRDRNMTEKDTETKASVNESVTDAENESEKCEGVVTVINTPLKNSQLVTTADDNETSRVACDKAVAVNDTVKLSTLQPASAVTRGSSLAAESTGKDEIVDEGDVDKLFACCQCSYKARKKGQLRKHLSVHKVYNCAHCEYSADTQGGLDEHMSIKHPSRCGRRLCKRCHMLFRAGGAFTQHVEQCTGLKLAWQCPTCAKQFKFISAMRTHVRRWHSAGGSDTQQSGSDQSPPAGMCSELSAGHSDSEVSSTQPPVSAAQPATQPAPGDVVMTTAGNSPRGTLPASSSSSATLRYSESTSSTPVITTTPVAVPTPADRPPPPPRPPPSARPLAAGSGPASDDALTCSDISVTEPTAAMMDTQAAVIDSDRVPAETPTANKHAAASATVMIDGEIRYICEHCPKSFKAKRSMVHHRRMIHEGGRLQKKQAAAVSSSKASAADGGDVTSEAVCVGADDDVEKSSDRQPTGDNVRLSATVMTADDTATESSDAVELRHNSSSSSTDVLPAASVRPVYSCSFTSVCSTTFKRLEQLRRHEEKHATPGLILINLYSVGFN